MNTEVKSTSITLQDSLSRLEVDIVGVASLADHKGTKLEESALKLLPGARSVVVFATELYREVLDLASPGKAMGVTSMNDLLDAHATYASGRLTKAAYDMTKTCHRLGQKALPLPAVGCPLDTRFLQAVISYKHAAQAAGVGTFGKHSLMITPRFGPRVRLACCLTEAALEPTPPGQPWDCGGCSVCIDNCPSKALSEPRAGEVYAINKFACSAFRTAAGGCIECLRLCPAGR